MKNLFRMVGGVLLFLRHFFLTFEGLNYLDMIIMFCLLSVAESFLFFLEFHYNAKNAVATLILAVFLVFLDGWAASFS